MQILVTCNVPVWPKNKKRHIFLVPMCLPTTPPNPLPHHSFHSSYLLFGQLTYFISVLSFFIFSHTPSSSPTVPTPNQYLHHHFSGKITGKLLWTHKHLHLLFFEVKFFNLFGGFYTFTWGYFYLNFNNDKHVIYEHWKWYLYVYMYRFCIGGIIWWVGIWFVLMMTT